MQRADYVQVGLSYASLGIYHITKLHTFADDSFLPSLAYADELNSFKVKLQAKEPYLKT